MAYIRNTFQVVALLAFVLVLSSCKARKTAPEFKGPDTDTEQPKEEEWASVEKRGKVKIVASPELPRVVFSTARGNIMLELFEDKTPNTTANMIYIIEKEMYKGSKFHRVEPGPAPRMRIIQGGGQTGSSPFDWQIKNEGRLTTYMGLKNSAGTVAMARTSDPNSGSNQFYININDHLYLDRQVHPYCVFGKVVGGMDAVKAVKAGDDFLDTWVVQKRDHKYIPTVSRDKGRTYAPAE